VTITVPSLAGVWQPGTTFGCIAGLPDPSKPNGVTPDYDDRETLFIAPLKGVSAKEEKIPDLPIVPVAEDEVTLPVVAHSAPAEAPKTIVRKEEWQRWNDYGIGLFLQGDLKAAAAAFAKITEADSIETNWVHTTPTSGIATAGEGTIQGPNFGNLCTGAGGGLTLGFWSNKNGQALESASDFTNLTALNLAKANGAAQDFTGSLSQNKTALNSFLLNANATNMANMLSAQLAAMYLNVVHGFVSGSAVLYVGNQPAGCTIPVVNGEITVSALITDANLELGAPGGNLTVASGQQRTCEEFKKTALDNANNNKNFVQPTACKHTFNTASCTF